MDVIYRICPSGLMSSCHFHTAGTSARLLHVLMSSLRGAYGDMRIIHRDSGERTRKMFVSHLHIQITRAAIDLEVA